MSQGSTGNSPWRDDSATIGDSAAQSACPVCSGRFVPKGRRIYCSVRCKHLANRRRHQELASSAIVNRAKPRRPITVYQCPSCEIRQLGIQRCEDCRTFMARVGIGGLCPHCDEPLAVAELMGEI